MKRMISAALLAGAALTVACSDDPNDGNILDLSPIPAFPICEEVGCLSDNDCEANTFCAAQTGQCAQCADNADCATLAASSTTGAFDGLLRCRNFECVCSDDDACRTPEQPNAVCVFGACAECGRDSDCDSGQVCVGAGDASAFCSQCESDAECAGNPAGPVCSDRLCGACGSDEMCTMTSTLTPFCVDRACGECVEEADCGDMQVCTSTTATTTCIDVECKEDDDCAGNANGTACRRNSCAPPTCASNADCANNPNGGACLSADSPSDVSCGCNTSADCAGRGSDCVDSQCRCADDTSCSVDTGDPDTFLTCRTPL